MATLNALNRAAFVVAAFVTTAHGYTNVFSDAVFWFRGGKDCGIYGDRTCLLQ